MFEYEHTRSKSYYVTGEIRKDFERTVIKSDPQSLAILCGTGVRIVSMVARVLLSAAWSRNPYRLPR